MKIGLQFKFGSFIIDVNRVEDAKHRDIWVVWYSELISETDSMGDTEIFAEFRCVDGPDAVENIDLNVSKWVGQRSANEVRVKLMEVLEASTSVS